MQVLKSEQVSFWDVDETLIIHVNQSNPSEDYLNVTDPLGGNIKVELHKPMLRLLREEIQRGGKVIVWSRGGWEWAQNVVIALGLEDKVFQVMSKPMVYFDDKPIDEWLTYRVYIKPDVAYKK